MIKGITIATWNVNGWTLTNSRIRKDILHALSIDIIGVTETFLKSNDVLSLPGYVWYGQNRQMLHVRANRGSGGIGCFVKAKLLDYFECHVINNSFEGILIIQLCNKYSGFKICLYIVYLPPERSMRGRDSDSFYEHLLSKLYMYTDNDISVILGDFNARIADKIDYVVDVDEDCISTRTSIDDVSNKHGESLIEFCIDSKCIILNGRITPEHDNFTFVSTRGRSVVDYILTPQSDLQFFDELKVMTVSDIVNSFMLTPPDGESEGHLPDHSVVIARINVHFQKEYESQHKIALTKTFYDTQNIPVNFMNDEESLQAVGSVLSSMQNSEHIHLNIDNIYEKICDIFHNEMNKKLLRSKNFKSKNHKRVPKPWWCEELGVLWHEVCISEKEFLKYKGKKAEKRRLLSNFKAKQHYFDRTYKTIKRKYQNDKLSQIKILEKSSPRKFWDALKKLGPRKEQNLPGEILLSDGSLSSDPEKMLNQWHDHFYGMFQGDANDIDNNDELLEHILQKKSEYETEEINPPHNYRYELFHDILNDCVTKKEVEILIKRAKSRKAVGVDEVPNEVLKNESSVELLYSLFSICFENGIVPSIWNKALLKPIPKGNPKDKRNPKFYRGISLISSIGKLYCAFLNQRLSVFQEISGLTVDEQNGFRASRSCLDHIFSLSSIIRNRLLSKCSTFCCFIDMAKAFDSVNHDCLLYKLQYNGIRGKIYSAIKSVLLNQNYAVKVNDKNTKWFQGKLGVRQGDPLSPSLFSLYINDLALELENMNLGVEIGDEIVNILLYADDLVIFAENEIGLQLMLNKCTEWCHQWRLNINVDKTKVMHFRNKSQLLTDYNFQCMGKNVETCNHYKYLGVIFDEHMKFDACAKTLSDSSSRAFGFVISKFKQFKTLDYDIFTKTFNTCLVPIMDYASGVWGFRNYDSLNVTQNRIMRYFLGVHKFAPTLGVWGDFGWSPAVIRRKVEMVRLWCRLIRMDDVRLTKAIFMNDVYNCKNSNLKNWTNEVMCIFEETNQMYLYETETVNFCLSNVLKITEERLLDIHKRTWCYNLIDYPKLRTYRLFKSDYCIEKYVRGFLNRSERSHLAQFRLGILPLKVETGRYTSPITPIEDRLCIFCNLREIENEIHFMLDCTLYNAEREQLFKEFMLKESILLFSKESMFTTIVCNSNQRSLARYIIICLQKRNQLSYITN